MFNLNDARNRRIDIFKQKVKSLESENRELKNEVQRLNERIVGYEENIEQVRKSGEIYNKAILEAREMNEKYNEAIEKTKELQRHYKKEVEGLLRQFRWQNGGDEH